MTWIFLHFVLPRFSCLYKYVASGRHDFPSIHDWLRFGSCCLLRHPGGYLLRFSCVWMVWFFGGQVIPKLRRDRCSINPTESIKIRFRRAKAIQAYKSLMLPCFFWNIFTYMKTHKIEAIHVGKIYNRPMEHIGN